MRRIVRCGHVSVMESFRLPRIPLQNTSPKLQAADMILRKNDSGPALIFNGCRFCEWEHGEDGGYAADRAMWALSVVESSLEPSQVIRIWIERQLTAPRRG